MADPHVITALVKRRAELAELGPEKKPAAGKPGRASLVVPPQLGRRAGRDSQLTEVRRFPSEQVRPPTPSFGGLPV